MESTLLHDCVKITRGVVVVLPGVGALAGTPLSEGSVGMSCNARRCWAHRGLLQRLELPSGEGSELGHCMTLEQDYLAY